MLRITETVSNIVKYKGSMKLEQNGNHISVSKYRGHGPKQESL